MDEIIADKLWKIKHCIVDILTENRSGVSLAQLPQILKRMIRFQFDLGELGFAKLKDLLGSMSEQVRMEIRGTNHPFAVLRDNNSNSIGVGALSPSLSNSVIYKGASFNHSSVSSGEFLYYPQNPLMSSTSQDPMQCQEPYLEFNKILESIRYAINTILHQFPTGVYSLKLPFLISMKTMHHFDIKQFGCSTIRDFLSKYIKRRVIYELIQLNPYEADYFLIRSPEAFMNYNHGLCQEVVGGERARESEPQPLHYKFDSYPKFTPNTNINVPLNIQYEYTAYSPFNYLGTQTTYSRGSNPPAHPMQKVLGLSMDDAGRYRFNMGAPVRQMGNEDPPTEWKQVQSYGHQNALSSFNPPPVYYIIYNIYSLVKLWS